MSPASPAAAIDLGSNALRVAIGTLREDNSSLQILASDRELLRLGADVFASGAIHQNSFVRTAAVLNRFAELAKIHAAKKLRAVATSAVREATNRLDFQNYLQEHTGILIDIIDGNEEARLVHLAVSNAIDLKGKTAILFDIGGGSIEVSLSRDGEISTSASFPIGAARLKKVLENDTQKLPPDHLQNIEQSSALTQTLAETIEAFSREHAIDLCIGTGGNIDAISDLNVGIFSAKSNSQVSLSELERILSEAAPMSDEQRAKIFKLKPDRAGIIVSAIMLAETVLNASRSTVLSVPHVGLKDGVLFDLLQLDRR